MGFVLEGTGPFGNVARPDGWQPGRTTQQISAACCPQCGSLEVHHKGAGRPGASLVYWQCVRCSHRWKMPERSAGRVTSVL